MEFGDEKGDKKVKAFKTLVQIVGLGVGGEEEYLIRNYGNLVVEYHGLTSDEEREKFKTEKMDPMYNKLDEADKRNPKVGEAVAKMIMAESMLS